ncbi:hypothetical protein Vadar_011202 [Vaccinium darrowii]|uniref:Uncharacterized protein n=1 Tax=Vaccinium darrowii TaxID=229202 RepID=A0ACB7WZS9_9ERIC|nr:hypothetical protein Vadar_011202 [Vaccinium darrowii]
MKLGLDRRTGLEWFLTTWKSRDDPGTGEYSYRVEPSELPQLVMFKGSIRVWRIPAWLARHPSAKPEATPSFMFNGTYVNNSDEVYMFYTLSNASNVGRMFVDELGYLKQMLWVGRWAEFYSIPRDQCGVYGRCGVYGYCNSNVAGEFECTCLPGYEPRLPEDWYLRNASGGCIKKRETLSMCGNGEGFVKVAYVNIPDTSKARVWMSQSVPQHMDSRRLNGKMVAVVVTAAVLTPILIITLVCWLVMKKRRRGPDIQDRDEENVELPIFDMVTIAGATNNFSDSNKIGEGGFGSVYKVILFLIESIKRIGTRAKGWRPMKLS